MGGGAMAYSLTRQGYSVLLLEKGKAVFADEQIEPGEELLDPDARLARGHWPSKIKGLVDSHVHEFWPALGCGIGGSTLLYAGALGRLDPIDFEKSVDHEASKPGWPFGYNELEPYYSLVEKLFRTCGTPDPLGHAGGYDLLDPPAMSDADRILFGKFIEAGLHPYRLHCAIEYKPGCSECGGVICSRSCKSDARSGFIDPALATGRLKILPEAEVGFLEADEERVQAAHVRSKDGRQYSAKVYVLAAGAFLSPTILLRSCSRHWPDGIGNESGLVGRNLMFHAADFVLMWPGVDCSRDGPKRSMAFRDYYTHAGRKLGEVQTMGLTAGYGLILTYLHQKFDQSRIRFLTPLRPLLRIPAFVASKLFKDATVFSAIVEDFPYSDNRVVLDDSAPSGFSFEYGIREELRDRVMLLRTLLRKRVHSVKSVVVNQGVALNFGHPCGTCKAGTERSNSVLDGNCKVHGMSNLYVVDSSFFPSSGGTNPSLTIAANALRVADIIGNRLADGFQSNRPE